MGEELWRFSIAIALVFSMVIVYELWKKLPFAARSVLGLAITGAFIYFVVLPVGVQSGQALYFLISVGMLLIYFAVLITRAVQAVRWTVRKSRGRVRDG